MADVSLSVLNALGVSKDLAYSESGGVLTPYHLSKQSGIWTVAVSGTATVSGTVAVTGVATLAKQDSIIAAINNGSLDKTKLVSGVATNTDGANTSVIVAQGSGIITYLTDVTVTNSSAAAVMAEVKDGSTVKWRFLVPAESGITHSFSSPLKGTANTAWNIDAASATTTIYASFAGFTS